MRSMVEGACGSRPKRRGIGSGCTRRRTGARRCPLRLPRIKSGVATSPAGGGGALIHVYRNCPLARSCSRLYRRNAMVDDRLEAEPPCCCQDDAKKAIIVVYDPGNYPDS